VKIKYTHKKSNPPYFFLSHHYNNYYVILGYSVADPEPGSGAFLTPGSGMEQISRSLSGMNILDHIPEILETIFGVKMLKYLMRIRNLFDRDGKN
jgi:hypothetical protein